MKHGYVLISGMPYVLKTTTLIYQLINLSIDEDIEIFIFFLWPAQEQKVMIKIKEYKRH